MIIHLPIAFMPTSDARHGAVQDVEFLYFDVPEVEPEQAPRVVTWRQHSRDGRPRGVPIVTRYYNWRWFEKVVSNDGLRHVTVRQFQETIRERAIRRTRGGTDNCPWTVDVPVYGLNGSSPRSQSAEGRFGSFNPEDWSELPDDRQGCWDRARRIYGNSFLVIKGKLWCALRPCEPAWQVCWAGGDDPVAIVISVKRHDDCIMPFAAHRNRRAWHFAQELADTVHRTVVYASGSLEVHASNLLTVNEPYPLERLMTPDLACRIARSRPGAPTP